MFGWLWTLLFKLGFWKKNATIVVLGLDNAGKTTLLYKLKNGSVSTFLPTQRALAQEVEVANITFKAWDLGGHAAVRDMWEEYYVSADGIVFMVDSADYARFGEARKELEKLLADASIASIPVAILANKSDISTAVPRQRLLAELGLDESRTASSSGGGSAEQKRPLEMFRCSLVLGVGFVEAFTWLGNYL